MSEFKKVGGDHWILDDLPMFYYHKKPPEWIIPYLKNIYTKGFSDGERQVQNKITEAFSFLERSNDG